ncbi:hypothetical protein [Pseudomonas coleopterorum]|uniref:HNH endonuclease n=1 Tax=Pseudomonas coleopterorum TaxID=1605838 RepID=A0ABR9C0R1_9PSED|nr:hypothetical protein [Pseudomonas coleopterorum]MBD8753824.1 hypothetical protein [Pseudomonas coleopterorum]MBD8770874.1 hypothetical protein [Pseudomonas coleopterorum]
MVARIPIPNTDSLAVISRLADERRSYKDFYNLLKPDWLLVSEIYISSGGCPMTASPLNLRNYTSSQEEADARKVSLVNLYSPEETQFQYSLLSSLRRDHGLIFCPCCGSHTVPGTLDHYLPKTSFPEFAVLLANLTPMCSTCQEEKGTSYLTEGGSKKFIHSYFDNIDFSFYKVKFEGDFSSPTFVFEFEEDIPLAFVSLVKEHASGVNIQKRFLSYCTTKYTHLLKIAHDLRQGGQESQLRMFISMFLFVAQQNSVNCWEAVFYRSVLGSEELLDYLCNGELPIGL